MGSGGWARHTLEPRKTRIPLGLGRADLGPTGEEEKYGCSLLVTKGTSLKRSLDRDGGAAGAGGMDWLLSKPTDGANTFLAKPARRHRHVCLKFACDFHIRAFQTFFPFPFPFVTSTLLPLRSQFLGPFLFSFP